MRLLNRLGLHWIDVLLFALFGGIYTAYGAYWSLSLVANASLSLQVEKDQMYYLLWFCAMGYAVIANSLILWRRAPLSGIIAFVVMLGVMVGTFFGMTALTAFLANPEVLSPSIKILSIAVGDLIVLLPIVTASIVFVIAWLVVGLFNHQREQPVTHGLIRLGMGLMLMPIMQFLVIFWLPRWDDEVRGVVFVHAMGLGLMWGLFLAGGLGANLRRPTTTSVVPVTAR